MPAKQHTAPNTYEVLPNLQFALLWHISPLNAYQKIIFKLVCDLTGFLEFHLHAQTGTEILEQTTEEALISLRTLERE